MKVYKDEKDIKDQILASLDVSVEASVKMADPKDLIANVRQIIEAQIRDLAADKKEIKAGNDQEIEELLKKHPFITTGEAILASSNCNKNDDIFLPGELWEARKTSIGTPFNNNHEKEEIIGHTYGSYVLDEDKKVVADDASEVPSYLHLVSKFVLYEDIFPDLTNSIAENKYKVSLEAKIKDFDYGLIDADNNVEVVARNDETSFLTKYLRVFGGKGVYKDYKIGRVARGLVFTGMGNVKDPANDESVYLKVEATQNASEKTMADNKEQEVVFEKKMADLRAEYEAKVAAAVGEKTEALANVAKLEASIKDLQAKVGVLENTAKELAQAKADLEASQSKVKEVSDELAKIRADETAKARVQKLIEAGVKVDKPEEMLAKIKEMSDAAFDSMLDIFKNASVGIVASDKSKQEEAEAQIEAAKKDAKVDPTTSEGNVSVAKELSAAFMKLKKDKNKGKK
jgi:hypothetical protein